MPSRAEQERIRRLFMQLYEDDPDFHERVDQLLAGEVADLRAALASIGKMRRDDFLTSFHYEVEVHRIVDRALRRLVA